MLLYKGARKFPPHSGSIIWEREIGQKVSHNIRAAHRVILQGSFALTIIIHYY